MVRVTWAPSARDDFEDIVRFLRRSAPKFAKIFSERVLSLAELLRKFPNLGQKVPEIDDPSVRQFWIRKYRIIYRIRGKQIEIYSILMGDTKFKL